MMKDVAIGRYVQGNSVLHRLDPRIKVVLFILYMVTIFLASTSVKMLATFAVVLFLALLSKIPPMEILRSVRRLQSLRTK